MEFDAGLGSWVATTRCRNTIAAQDHLNGELFIVRQECNRALARGHLMMSSDLSADLYGWWRITEASQWVNEGLDDLGPAMLSITGHADRLRMHCLLAYVNVKPTKSGASFSWSGAWEYDQMSGTGSVRLGKDGKLHGRIKIKDSDSSTFIAERTSQPTEPIPDPPRYRDKWTRRR